MNVIEEFILKIVLYLTTFFLLFFVKIKNRKVANILDYRFNINYKQIFISSALSIIVFLIVFSLFPIPIEKIHDIMILIIVFLAMIVFGPAFEEIVFRGSLLGFFMTRFKGMIFYFGFLLQLFLFVSLHFLGGTFTINGVIYRIVGGILHSALFVLYKRNLIPTIISHSMWNLTLFTLFI